MDPGSRSRTPRNDDSESLKGKQHADHRQSFRSKAILDGIRRWVEIETPTEAPEQVNKLATMVADGYRDLPVAIERVAGHSGCGDHLVVRS